MWVLFKVIKMKNKILLCPLLLLVLLFCSACQNPIIAGRRPCSQPNTKWMSEDETIEFTVNADNCATGKMILDGETIEFYMANDTGSGMHLFPIEVLEDSIIDTNDEYEYWLCSFENKGKFIANVKSSTYFNVGKKIVFHRVDQEGS